MSEQLALTIVAAALGFVAAILLCVGNALNASQKILQQATPYWDFNRHFAESLTAQRVQYIVGAVLLFIAFGFQLAAALASTEKPAQLPSVLGSWFALAATVVVIVSIFSWLLARLLFRRTFAKVLALNALRIAEDERVSAEVKSNAREAPLTYQTTRKQGYDRFSF